MSTLKRFVHKFVLLCMIQSVIAKVFDTIPHLNVEGSKSIYSIRDAGSDARESTDYQIPSRSKREDAQHPEVAISKFQDPGHNQAIIHWSGLGNSSVSDVYFNMK